ncbi:MAG: hypothetical protein BWY83_01796 [bacterium ADurb.Bin478]|nr:MAG: hypothetical protein BWY83_01796 [bacterium ADurb.Bin478]
MKRHQLHGQRWRPQCGDKTGDLCDRLRPVVHARNDRNAKDQRRGRFSQAPYIFQYATVALAGALSMRHRIEHLDVDQKQIDPSKDRAQVRPAGRCAGLHRRVHAGRFARLQQSAGELRLQQRLASGEGDAASGGGEKGLISQELRQKLCYPHAPAARFQSAAVTLVDAAKAGATTLSVDPMLAGLEMVKVIRTGCHAGAAPGAAVIPVLQRRQQVQAFRIVAPETAKGTALEKNRGANAGSVMN